MFQHEPDPNKTRITSKFQYKHQTPWVSMTGRVPSPISQLEVSIYLMHDYIVNNSGLVQIDCKSPNWLFQTYSNKKLGSPLGDQETLSISPITDGQCWPVLRSRPAAPGGCRSVKTLMCSLSPARLSPPESSLPDLTLPPLIPTDHYLLVTIDGGAEQCVATVNI